MARLFVLILLIFVFAPTQAQDEIWPLTPEQIFAPDIKITYSMVPHRYNQDTWSNELRVLAIGGDVYRYPAEFERVTEIGEVEGQFLIRTFEPGAYNAQLWLFDRGSQRIGVFESQCGADALSPLAFSDVFENPWTIIENGDESVLCNHVTGELSQPLPPDHIWNLEFTFDEGEHPKVSTSEDGQYVAFIGIVPTSPDNPFGPVDFFSYNTETQEIINLGQRAWASRFGFGAWFGSQVLFQLGEHFAGLPESTSILDAAVPDSIELAYSYAGAPAFLDDPPRYVFDAADPENPTGCGHRVYDITTRTMIEHDLGGCRPDFGSIDGVGYYRNIPMLPMYECCNLVPERVATVSVTRWDAATGESEDVYEGEVEQVMWVSSDDRYAILLLDNNGVIDNVPYSWDSPLDGDYSQYGVPRIALVDLEFDEVISQTFPGFGEEFTIAPLNDREFVVFT